MISAKTYWWTDAPFLRLIIPLIIGIAAQWYLHLSATVLIYAGISAAIAAITYSLLPVSYKFRFSFINGLCINLLLLVLGALLTKNENVRNNDSWFGHTNNDGSMMVVSINESLTEKPASYKTVAVVNEILNDSGRVQQAKGKVILYLKKEAAQNISYGSRLLISKPAQPIKNSGNPGAFDYQRYCLFQGITHQIYLTENDFTILEDKNENVLDRALIQSRLFFVRILKKYINGDKESGLAEALLIGYKDDLDKGLVQAYSNTGVVHIIAISGMHLALIYQLLIYLTLPFARFKKLNWLRFLVIASVLWLFTLLAGAQPSVLRSAVMFSCVALGTMVSKRISVYNTLALSAFLLLCINPFWLWDVGFQLSYAAVMSIVIFFPPIYKWFYFPNKSLDCIWKLIAVTFAAQILTLPICLYHFHQFPILFLLTNLVAVPLSGIILLGEIVLCLLSFIPIVASVIGAVLKSLIWLMNYYIERFDSVSFAVWNGLSISFVQVILLFFFIGCLAYWLLEQRKRALFGALACLVLVFILRTISFMNAGNQQKLIVYNVPKYQAIDFIEGRNIHFTGDSILMQDPLLYNFYLKPSRILFRAKTVTSTPDTLKNIDFAGKKICIIDQDIFFLQTVHKPQIDLLILSKNPRVRIKDIFKAFDTKQIVIDGSVPAWKAKLWKKDCDSLHLACFDVAEKGAFEMNLQ